MLMQNQVKMSIQEFAGYVAENIRNYMPEEYGDADVTVRKVFKDNDTELMAVDIRRSGETMVPSVYLNDLYDWYMCGEDLTGLVSQAADARVIHDAENLLDSRIVTNSITDYEAAKKNLVISICCSEWNRKRLDGKVTRQAGEFTEFYRVAVDLDPDRSGSFSSVAVTEEILGMWGAAGSSSTRMPFLRKMPESRGSSVWMTFCGNLRKERNRSTCSIWSIRKPQVVLCPCSASPRLTG